MIRSFRAQLIVSFFLVIVVTPLLFFGIFYPALGRYLHSSGSHPSLRQHARAMAGWIEAQAARGTALADLDPLLRAVSQGTRFHYRLLDRDGRVVADTTDRRKPAPESSRASAGRLRQVTVPLRVAGKQAGILLVEQERPNRSFFRPLHFALRTLFGLLIAGVFGLLLSRRLLRPVDQLTHAAEAMAAGDLSQRVKVPPHGELGRLAERFNHMAARIEELVTRLSREHERLRAVHADLADSERRQRELIANVSHELRTPLACVRAAAEAILDGVADSEEKRERCLRTVEEEGASLARLVEDLLTLSRLDSGQTPLRREAVPLARLLERSANRFRARSESGGIALAWQCSEAISFPGDEERLAQVLSNLLDNALRHTPPGGRIRLEGGEENGQVRLRVSDTGCGIPPEHLPHVCERLYRVEKSRCKGAGGAGLGLAIAREIVEAHGGTMALASAPGEGTAVTICLGAPA